MISMLEFKTIVIKDKEWADTLMSYSGYQGAEYCFTNLFIWDGIYKSKLARYKDFLLLRTGEPGNFHYLYPAGRGDIKEVLDLLAEEASLAGEKLSMICLSERTKRELDDHFPQRFNYTPVRNTFDYIYDTEALISLSGKKLQPKRNHINYFVNNYNWSYEDLTPDKIDEVMVFNLEWCKRTDCKKYETLMWESCAVEKCLSHYQELKLKGGILRVDGSIVAYTIGEALNSDTFVVHIEKAFPEFRGSYPMINREFLKRNAQQFKYVNREDDIGDEGLRKAKESYYPAFMLEKFSAELF